VKRLSRLYPEAHIYVLDVKRRDFNDWPGILSQDEAPPPLEGNNRVQVWQPIVEEEKEIEKWLGQIEHDAPALLFIDELAALCYGPRRVSQKYRRLQKLGRGLPVGTISLTQELVEIPRQAIGQATHVVRFRLLNDYEQRLGNKLTRRESHAEEPPHRFGFFYTCEDIPNMPCFYYSDKDEFFEL